MNEETEPRPDPQTVRALPPDPPTGAEPVDPALLAEMGRSTRTALVVSILLAASSALGLLRDLSLAALFGASSDTDAFLVAWTIPETVSVLMMEGALSYLLVPVFVREVTRRGDLTRLVRATLLPMLAMLAVSTVAVAAAAPVIVDMLAPGIADRELAVRCFRVSAMTVLLMGLSGYFMAALRANQSFVRPASIYVFYNIGILVTMYALHSRLGVFSAALGLVVGSALMVLVQIPGFVRVTSLRGLTMKVDKRITVALVSFIPIAAYSMGRQMQVFVERIVGSTLDPGSISYLNYASKVAQMAMLFALTAASVAFPALARMASDRAALAVQIGLEFRRILLLILPAIAFLIVFAAPTVQLLFERGAFGAADTARTVGVMRIYTLGLFGQVLIGLGAMTVYSTKSRSWDPAVAAAVGLVVTIVLDVSLAPVIGLPALAVGNVAGITVAAVMLWNGIRRRVVSYDARGLSRLTLALTPLAIGAAAVAYLLCQLASLNALGQVLVGGMVTSVLFLLLTIAGGVVESREVARYMWKLLQRASRQVYRPHR